jgi:hypothetical protein
MMIISVGILDRERQSFTSVLLVVVVVVGRSSLSGYLSLV